VIQTGQIVLHDFARELMQSDFVRKSYLGERT
jgi:ABC-type lipopolysaccharide export system ATPase subunit